MWPDEQKTRRRFRGDMPGGQSRWNEPSLVISGEPDRMRVDKPLFPRRSEQRTLGGDQDVPRGERRGRVTVRASSSLAK